MKKRILLLLALLGTALGAQAQNDGQFILRGQAVRLSQSCYQITPDDFNQFGVMWWDSTRNLNQAFELEFVLFAGTRDRGGADGFAFVMHNDPRGFEARGEAGGGLGFGDHPSQNNVNGGFNDLFPIIPSVAVEYDTWRNRDCSPAPDGGQTDPRNGDGVDVDHTTIVYNGDICDPQSPRLQINPNDPDIENNQCFDYRLTWDPATQTLRTFFDGQLVIEHTDDLVNNVFNGNPIVTFGFTGSTGGARNEQTVCVSGLLAPPIAQDDFASINQGQTARTSVLSNDQFVGDLFTAEISDGPSNGIAVLNSDPNSPNFNTIEYTPNANFVGFDTVRYRACDVPEVRCYATCDDAEFVIEVGCTGNGIEAFKVKDNGICTPSDGSPMPPFNGAARARVSEQGANRPEIGFTFNWYFDDPADPAVPWETPPVYVGSYYTNMAPGTYYVRSSKHTNGCRSIPVEIVIEDIPESTLRDSLSNALTLTELTPVTICAYDPSNPSVGPDGSATADVDGETNGYTFAWTEEQTGDTVSIAPFADQLLAIEYQVFVEDNTTRCIGTESIELTDNLTIPEVSTIASQDITQCTTDGLANSGSIEITDVTPAGGNYVYQWYDGATPLPDESNLIAGEDQALLDELFAGEYNVIVRNLDDNCQSDPLAQAIEIADNVDNEFTVSASGTVQIPCFSTDGTIRVDAVVPNTDSPFAYNWYSGNVADPTDPVTSANNGLELQDGVGSISINAAGDEISGLSVGNYFVVVTKANNCKALTDFNIGPDGLLPNLAITPQASTDCEGDGDALIAIGNIASYAGTFPLANSYTWYRGFAPDPANEVTTSRTGVNFAPHGHPGDPNVDPDYLYSDITGINDLEPGTYTVVMAAETADNLGNPVFCNSAPATFTIDDTAVRPEINATVTAISNCADTGEGSLLVEETTGIVDPMTFTWYKVAPEDIDAGTPVLGTTTTLADQTSGTFSVIGAVTATGCADTTSVELLSRFPNALLVSISAVDKTNCLEEGSMTAFIRSPTVDNFGETRSYEYRISGPVNQGFQANNEFEGLPVGAYNLEVRDVADNTCALAQPAGFDIRGLQPQLQPFIIENTANFNCDPSNPQGALYAAVTDLNDMERDSVAGYEFLWYNNGDLSTNPPSFTGFLGSSSSLVELAAGDYYLSVRDLATGCTASLTTDVLFEPIPVPAPDPYLIQPKTNCLTNNGAVGATVNGEAAPYIFAWYRNSVRASEDFSGHEISGLAPITFFVTATDRFTGCVSEPAQITVPEALAYPNFTVLTENADCDEPNGVAEFVLTAPLIPWKDAFWTNEDGQVFFTPVLTDQPAGNYTVSVISDEDCETTREFTLFENVDVFNGVSPNNDGINDFLQIGCIDSEFVDPNAGGGGTGGGPGSLPYDPTDLNDPLNPRSPNFDPSLPGTLIDYDPDDLTDPRNPASPNFDPTLPGAGDPNDIYGEDTFLANNGGGQSNLGFSTNTPGRNTLGFTDGQVRVRIYNRSGALVFEVDDYDNSVNRFEGFGNRGVYLGKKELPSGTYFYIIDREGQKPISGYLELFR